MQKINQAQGHPPASQTDWDYFATATDEDIQRGIDNDPDTAPALIYDETKSRYKPHPPRITR